ncbi:MAG: pyruvate dehydrogenase (acetyl-transferring), homodimeric type [Myxococcota bacterium]
MNDNTGRAVEALENEDWIQSLDDAVSLRGPGRAFELIERLGVHASGLGLPIPSLANTSYINTIPADHDPDYPGDLEMETRIKNILRWNAMAMVVRANKRNEGIGGHIATYASVAAIFETGFHHIFRGPDHPCGGDHLYIQGHASPGIYARAFMEGRLSQTQIENFRLELADEGGLPSYPHPWLMPDFWQYPTVSMGLGPIMSAYQARFLKYLANRGIADTRDARVYAFLGDGEMDEPESTGVINFAARECLCNLTWVINCNLQRLDGPVRGNGKIIQELERLFRGGGWNVVKVLWGTDWDPIFARDKQGLLRRRLDTLLDGEWQKCRVEGGGYLREQVFGLSPELKELVEHLSDDDLINLATGGHDPIKMYAAYRNAQLQTTRPTVILAQTIKGFGMGSAGEGLNITHQQKKLNIEQLKQFRDRFRVSLSDDELESVPLIQLDKEAPEVRYLLERREKLGGFIPARRRWSSGSLEVPGEELVEEFLAGSERPASTTGVFVRILTKLLKDERLAKRIVPIIPDEARTFGMDGLFRQFGIYNPAGQLYEPVDAGGLLYYREATDGQILEEGITEAGAMSSFIAAGTAYSSVDEPMVPFYVFYSMFGFQRIGDLAWAAGDCRTRGFLIGGTAGRTTLNGEGLQHEDGHSHVLASTIPNLKAYDPTYAAEMAIIVQDGLRRMYTDQEDVFFYLTVGNESYVQEALPEGDDVRAGVIKGMYRLRSPSPEKGRKKRPKAQLLGSGAIMSSVLEAQRVLAENYGVDATVWSVTSYTELRKDALEAERYNMFHPTDEPRQAHVRQCIDEDAGVVVAASDYMKVLPDGIAKWLPVPLISLGTDGYGRSETRAALRDFFEVDTKHVVWATLVGLFRTGSLSADVLDGAKKDLGINSDKINPMQA